MTLQRTYPFRRVSVDHMIYGTTRIWWQLEPEFNDAGPYVFQLQVGNTGLREADNWQDIGAPVLNGYVAFDDKRHNTGTVWTAHYRVTLTTARGVYVSAPSPSVGELSERDWVLAREIIRKETLRHQKVSIGGFLVKAFRYGSPCPRCRDALTQESGDTDCPVCYGTGLESGYHPPLPLQCWDLSPQVIDEQSDAELRGTTRDNGMVTARVIGFPALNARDIWVNETSDERWVVRAVKVAAALRGVPLVYDVQLEVIPISNVIYYLPLSSAEAGPPSAFPTTGNGCVTVGQNYGGADLRYLTALNEPINNANVYAFQKAVFDRAFPDNPPRRLATAATQTNSAGNWTANLALNPGQYVLLYEKPDAFGPDIAPLTVVEPVCNSSSSSSSSSCPNNHPPAGPVRQVNTFWDI